MMNMLYKSNKELIEMSATAKIGAAGTNIFIHFSSQKDKVNEADNFIMIRVENNGVIESIKKHHVSSAQYNKAVRESLVEIQKYIDCKSTKELLSLL